jgi:hypothetical protein
MARAVAIVSDQHCVDQCTWCNGQCNAQCSGDHCEQWLYVLDLGDPSDLVVSDRS